MTKHTRVATNLLLSVGMVSLFTVPATCQVPAKFFSNLRNFFRPRVMATPNAPAQALAKGVSAAPVYIPQSPVAKNSAAATSALRPLTDPTTEHAQSLLAASWRKPANDFYGLFKQTVYAHQNNKNFAKRMKQDYFYEVYFLLQNAAHLEKIVGYDKLAAYLRQHHGQMPTLMPYGTYQATPQARQRLTFFAGEELNSLLGKMLSRKPAKRQPTADEWIAINVLSVMLPSKSRLLFYDLLLEKRYEDLQAIALDPYLKDANTMRRIQQKQSPVLPTQEERVARYKQILNNLANEQQKLQKTLPYQRQQYTKNNVIYSMLRANNQTQDAAAARKELDKASRKLQRTQKRLQEVADLTQRLNFELRFVQGE